MYGGAKGESAQDAEGMQTMRTLARNMAFLMKSIALGKEQYRPAGERARPAHQFHPVTTACGGCPAGTAAPGGAV